MQSNMLSWDRHRWARAVWVVSLLLWPLVASAKVSATLQGQSANDPTWIGSNLTGWHELDYIPVRILLTGGPVSGQVLRVDFDHVIGIQNLTGFTPSTNVIITAGPTLSAPPNSATWSYSFTVNLTNNVSGFVEFRARLTAGAHLNPGGSLHLSGTPSLGQLQIFKPAAGPGLPDLAIRKTASTGSAPGTILTYTLNYTNKLTSSNTAIGVQVSDVLPPELTYVAGSASAGGSAVGNTLYWDITNLVIGAQGFVTYQAVINSGVPYGQVFSNYAQILSSEDDFNYADNAFSVSKTVVFNRAPVGNNDSYSIPEFQTLTVPVPGVLTNDTDVDGDSLTVALPRPVSGPAHGSLTLNSNGSFSYTPTGNYTGTDTFTYMANDGATDSVPATVTISVLQVTTPPSITCPAALTVGCSASVPPPDTTLVTASDHCGGGSVVVTFISDTMSASNCFDTFVITRTYRATDLCGNHADCAQTINVRDTTPPTITCPGPESVSCASAIPAPNTSLVTASDGCGAGPVTVAFISDTIGSSNCFSQFVITRTYRATDVCGNFSQCAQTITVHDATPPIITCPDPVSVSCASALPAPNTSLVTASDGCGGGAVTVTFISDMMSASNCFNQFVIMRTYRATDVCGNFAECAQSITVQDITLPIITCPAPVTVSCASALPVPDASLVTASDGCGGEAATVTFVSDTMSTSNCFNQFVITRTYRATDVCGNFAECAQSITVQDVIPPTITCPAPLTVTCASELPAADISLVTASDGCGGGAVTVAFVSDAMSASNCFNQFVITRTYRATDVCGNFADCTQTITVRDVTPPTITCPAPVTVSCASALPAPDISLVTASDGCGGGAVTVAFISDAISVSNCLNQFVITRIYRASDVCGNFADCTQSITVQDITPPTITCPAPLTVSCASALPAADIRLVTAGDGCGGGAVTVAFISDAMSASNCFNEFVITRTYRATDACGNFAECTQRITVQDVTPPTITCPAPIVVSCGSDLPVPDTSLVRTSDGCGGGAVTVMFVSDTMGASNCLNQFVITRTYRATDVCGNFAECTQSLTVQDITPPLITCPGPMSVSCASGLPAPDTSLVTASDGCPSGAVTVTFVSDIMTASNCFNQFVITRTYRATDVCGNFAECSQSLTIHDITPPTITCPGPATVSCASALLAPDISLVTASDGCGGGAVTVTFVSDTMSASNCPNQFLITRTYRATDVCGNHAECTQSITIQDVTPPIITCPAPVSVSCASALPAPDVSLVTASDGCGSGAAMVTFVSDTMSASNCFNQFVITRTYRATDVCGNHADCTQTITVQDIIPPVITCPAPVTVSCASALPARDISLVTASDGCGGGAVTVTFVSDTMSASNCFNQFVITRTYRATDVCGNHADCTQTITVQDVTPPTLTCPAPVSVSCVSALPAPDIRLVTAGDGCGGGAVTVTFVSDAMSASNCFNQFVITRTYRATDVCGNHAECAQSITVQDVTPPTLTCPASLAVSCAAALPAPDISLVTASDGCGGGAVTVTFVRDAMSASNCLNQFVIMRTYRAIDVCGHHAECTQSITVQDVTPPLITCPAPVSVSCASALPARDVSLVTASAGCGSGAATVTFVGDTMSASNCFNQFVITRTYRATDVCGNHAECTQSITIQDVTPPIITCPAPVSVSCASALPAPDIRLVTASDGCGGGAATVTFVNDTMSASNCFNKFVITRTYRATDVCGNHAECTQSITVQDITPPTITCPAPVTVSCASAMPAPDISLVTASDGCGGGAVTVTFVSDAMSASNCFNQFVITRAYRATDVCGNHAECTQTITVRDVTLPTITCPAPLSVSCASALPAPDIRLVTASDGCGGGAVTVTFVSDAMSASNCLNQFVITRTYRATDVCGNHAECAQSITVRDVTPPTLTCPAPLTVSCVSALPAPDISLVTASDGCGGGAATVTFVSDAMSASNCLNQFVITRTYRATDVCGNHSECAQNITVQDITPPVITCPAPVSVSCASALPAPNISLVTASDGCGGGAITVTFVSDAMSASNCFNQFVITRTYRATDVCGNHAECAQSITVRDVTAPTITCPAPISVSCASAIPAPDPSLVTSSDGCGGGLPTVTFVSDTISASNCLNHFVITRTYRATDACGNFAECTQSIAVQDATPPTITCPAPISVSCVSPVPTPDTSSVIASDGCGGAVTVTFVSDTLSTPIDCFHQSILTRTYRATDVCGNQAECTQTITVLPINHAPVPADDGYTINEDTVLSITAPGILANDTDGEGDVLTASLLSLPAHGSLSLSNNGAFLYTPANNYNGTDSFTYQASDGQAQSGVATVTISIRAVNDAPSFTKGPNQVIPQDIGSHTVPNWATSISSGPPDETAQSLSFTVTTDTNALFSVPPAITSNGTLTYTPVAGAYGVANVTVTLTDNGGTMNGGVDTSAAQSFTITLNAPPLVSIVSPADGTLFMAPANLTVIADAYDFSGIVTNIQILRGANILAQTNTAPGYAFLTNVPAGIYQFSARASDSYGVSSVATPISVTVLERPPLTIVQASRFNSQKGLFEQIVRVSNPTATAFSAVRVYITGLRTNVVVFNASGKSNGVPYVQSIALLDPGASVDFTIEYSVPDFIAPNPILVTEIIQPLQTASAVNGTFVRVTREMRMLDGEFLLEFPSLSNRVYFVQYSSNMKDWKTSSPGVRGSGQYVQWMDNGAPRTESWPASNISRFYRVLLVP